MDFNCHPIRKRDLTTSRVRLILSFLAILSPITQFRGVEAGPIIAGVLTIITAPNLIGVTILRPIASQSQVNALAISTGERIQASAI